MSTAEELKELERYAAPPRLCHSSTSAPLPQSDLELQQAVRHLEKARSLTRWLPVEDEVLRRCVREKGETPDAWRLTVATLTWRTPRKCRERWVCYANPALRRGAWSDEEKLRFRELFVEHQGSLLSIAREMGRGLPDVKRHHELTPLCTLLDDRSIDLAMGDKALVNELDSLLMGRSDWVRA